MTDQERNMLVCSTSRAITKMRYFGDSDIQKVQLLKTILKYKEYISPTESSKCGEKCIEKINELILNLESSSSTICHIDYTYVSNSVDMNVIVPSESKIRTEQYNLIYN